MMTGNSSTPSSPPGAAVDVADHRNVIPDGLYLVTVTAGSCNVNDIYRSTRPVWVGRSRAGQEPGINIPLPWTLYGEDATPAMGPGRTDIKLATRFAEFTRAEPASCTGGNVRRANDIEAIAPRSMTISFETEGIACRESLP